MQARRSRASKSQMAQLVRLVIADFDILLCGSYKQRKKRWNEIATILNRNGAQKPPEQWAKVSFQVSSI